MTDLQHRHAHALTHAHTHAEREAILWAIRNDERAYFDALDVDIALFEYEMEDRT